MMLMRTVLTIFVLLIGGAVSAHALNIFVTVSGTDLTGQAFFTGAGPAKNLPVELESTQDGEVSVVLETDTSLEGTFELDLANLAVAADASLVVAVESVDGHRATWSLSEQDLAGLPSPAPARNVSVPQVLAGLAGIAVLTTLLGRTRKRRG